MNFTNEEIESFKGWERTVQKKTNDENYGRFYNLPPAPANYDLWKYGPELPLEGVEHVRCQGGNLVKVEWMIR